VGRKPRALEGPHADVRGLAGAGLELGEHQHLAEHLQLEGLAHVGVVRETLADDAAHVQQVHGVAGLQGLGHDALVALQGVAVAQGAHEDVPVVQRAHAAMRIFQLVVGALLAPHAAGDDGALFEQDLAPEGEGAAQPQVAGD